MADKSKRAKTSVPRTGGQKTSENSESVATPKAKKAPSATKSPAKKVLPSAELETTATTPPVSAAISATTSMTEAAVAATPPTTEPIAEPKPMTADPAVETSAATPETTTPEPALETSVSPTAEPAPAESAAKTPSKTATKAKTTTKKAAKKAPASETKIATKKPTKAASKTGTKVAAKKAAPEPTEPAAPAPDGSEASPTPAENPPAAAVPPAAPPKKKATKKAAKKKASKAATPRASSLPLKHYEFIGVPSLKGQVVEARTLHFAPPPPPPKELTLEERLETLQARLGQQSEALRRQLQEQLDMSWIYHDSALEGLVYSFHELKTALGPDQTLVQESNLQPTVEQIRRHRAAIEFVRECAKKKTPITVDLIKRIYLTLHPEEGDLKTVKYRKDIPQHRLYFHEYAQPDKIAPKVRQVVDWLNEPEAQKGRNALRVAARAHYDLLRAFPFQTDSGKVARLLMNLLLLQSGYEPAIIHSTERQRYYDALKGSATTIISMVVEAEENAVMSLEKLLDEREARRGFAG